MCPMVKNTLTKNTDNLFGSLDKRLLIVASILTSTAGGGLSPGTIDLLR